MEEETKKALDILDDSDRMSSKFAEVGRNIVFALIAGSWLLLRYSSSENNPVLYIKIAFVCAFVYLLIDLVYYCSTMIIYWRFVIIDIKESTISVKDEGKTFKIQKLIKQVFMIISIIKTFILLISIICIILFIFLSDLNIKLQ